MKKNFSLTKLLPFIFYILLWQFLSLAINQPILFPSFITVAKCFFNLLKDGNFLLIVFRTCGGILAGFFLSLFFGIFLAQLSAKNDVIKDFLAPLLMIMKTVPVVSIIILLFMWLDNGKISAAVSFMMVFPIVYHNIYDGFKSKDEKLNQMIKVFKVRKIKSALYVTFPQIYPFLKAACKTGIGVSFKSGVAAEVITVPIMTIGESLYNSKVYFDSASLLAWTAALIFLTALFEKIILKSLDCLLLKIEGGLKWI